MAKKPTITQAEALEWKRLYEEEGYTIEALSLDFHRSRDTIRKTLHDVGTAIRPAHGPGGRPGKAKLTDGKKGVTENGPRKVRSGGRSYRGHRRGAW